MFTREPAVAGTFYPENPTELRQFCHSNLKPAPKLLKAKAIILPHAGYIYSAPTACSVLSRIHVPEKVFLIGPNHRGIGRDFALYAQGEWQTPLGMVPIDEVLSQELLRASAHISFDRKAHQDEHSLEVEIPLLQSCRPDIHIVPMIVGTLDLQRAHEVAEACGAVLSVSGKEALSVISNDMSHYESDQITRKKDRYALDAILNLDEEALTKSVYEHRITMCGFIPVFMLLCMKEKLGIRKASLIDYRTSADASGDKERVVGYAGFIFE